jgi:putrescine aminotransferase
MSATGLQAFWPMFEPRTPGFSHIDAPDPYRFASPDPAVSLGVAAANTLEEAILREGPETVAAFIAEPVQGAGGVIVPPPDYFSRIREICRQYDVLFIADEVITGFGRTGRWFGLEHYGVEPDIMQFAKGITSGYVPLGGIGVSDTVRDVINGVPAGKRWMHAYTYSGHPTCCAVALENIAILERERLPQRAEAAGARLLNALRSLESLEGVGHVRGLGLMAGVEVVADKATRQLFPAQAGRARRHLPRAAARHHRRPGRSHRRDRGRRDSGGARRGADNAKCRLILHAVDAGTARAVSLRGRPSAMCPRRSRADGSADNVKSRREALETRIRRRH